MREVAERLLLVLGAEEEIYARMRDLLQLERERLVELDEPGLEEIVREKEVLV